MSDVDPAALDWLDRYATAIGVPARDSSAVTSSTLGAGTAAHASHRQAAPVACWLAARAGLSPTEALTRANDLPG